MGNSSEIRISAGFGLRLVDLDFGLWKSLWTSDKWVGFC